MSRSAAVCCGHRTVDVFFERNDEQRALGLRVLNLCHGMTVVQDPRDAGSASAAHALSLRGSQRGHFRASSDGARRAALKDVLTAVARANSLYPDAEELSSSSAVFATNSEGQRERSSLW
jgi:hypothetical protein